MTNTRIKSEYLSSVGKEFHIVGLQTKMSDDQMSLTAVCGCMKFHCQKNSIGFTWVCRLRVNQISKQEISLKRKSDRQPRVCNLCGP